MISPMIAVMANIMVVGGMFNKTILQNKRMKDSNEADVCNCRPLLIRLGYLFVHVRKYMYVPILFGMYENSSNRTLNNVEL